MPCPALRDNEGAGLACQLGWYRGNSAIEPLAPSVRACGWAVFFVYAFTPAEKDEVRSKEVADEHVGHKDVQSERN